MFLRFYGVDSEKRAKECIEELRPIATGLVRTDIADLTRSVNLFLPEGENKQVRLTFNTRKNLLKFYNDPKVMKIYRKYSRSKELGKPNPVKRVPTDLAWVQH